MRKNVRFAAIEEWHLNGFGVYMIVEDHAGRVSVGKPVEMTEPKPIEENAAADHSVGPTFRIDRVAAQALVNELWNKGVRPTQAVNADAAVAAAQGHIDDLRKVAFTLLDKATGLQKADG